MSLFKRTLEQALAAGELVTLHRGSLRSCTTGYVTHVGRELVALQEVAFPGGYDGVVVLWLDDVSAVRRGGASLERLARTFPRAELPAPANLSVDSIETVLRSVNEQFGHVSVLLEEEDDEGGGGYVGELLETDGEFFRLREFDASPGPERPEGVFRLEDVTRVEADGRYERELLRHFEG